MWVQERIQLETLRKALDTGYISRVLLTDLSRAFDCISHELLIEKLYAYGFSKCALNLIIGLLQL